VNLAEVNRNLPARCRDSMLLAKYLECRLKGEFEESVKYCKLRYKLVTQYPDVFKDYLLDPKHDSLELLITSAIRLKNFSEARSVFSRLKKIIDNTDDIDLTITGYDIRFSEYIENENKKAGDVIIPEIEEYFIKHSGKILVNTENYFRFNIAKYYFITGNYLAALEQMNKFLSSKMTKLTPEFESYSRIINILIHYELGNFGLLKYLIPTTKKYLLNKNKYFRFVSEILRSVKKLIGLKDDISVTKCFNDLFKKILMLKKNKFEKNAFVYFDPEKWIEKKILLNKY
jgi:hypothetical protein